MAAAAGAVQQYTQQYTQQYKSCLLSSGPTSASPFCFLSKQLLPPPPLPQQPGDAWAAAGGAGASLRHGSAGSDDTRWEAAAAPPAARGGSLDAVLMVRQLGGGWAGSWAAAGRSQHMAGFPL